MRSSYIRMTLLTLNNSIHTYKYIDNYGLRVIHMIQLNFNEFL